MKTKRQQQYWLRGLAKAADSRNAPFRALREAGVTGFWISQDGTSGYVKIDPTRLKMRKGSKKAKYEAVLQGGNQTLGLLEGARYVVILENDPQQSEKVPLSPPKKYTFVPIADEVDDLADLQLTEDDLEQSFVPLAGVSACDLSIRGGKRATLAQLKSAGCESSAP